MNTIQRISALAALLAVPLAASAQMTGQSNDSLTRQQVKDDLVQMEQQGYNPTVTNEATYPQRVEAADARIGAMQLSQTGDSQYGYGGVPIGTSASGGPDQTVMQPAHVGNSAHPKPVYFGR